MMQVPTFGSFGDSLDDAVRTEFFSFFHLVEDGRDTYADETAVVRFRPGGEYRPFTACGISTRVEGLMDRMALTVDGAFIDSPEIWRLARDITRSFIRDALAHQSDFEQVQEIIRDLLYRPQIGAKRAPVTREEITAAIYRGERVIVRRGSGSDAPGELPPVVSRGFAVYTGDRDAFIRDLVATRLTMRNSPVGGRRVLEIAFDRYQ
jgi:hypothetical protein